MTTPVIALLGAESTGKTTLAVDLAGALAARGLEAVVVGELLREFCDRHGRTPNAGEQAAIAAGQTARIEAARAASDVVVADTTALMIAVYSDLLFADAALYDEALAAQRRMALTLVTANDLPWQADGLQRDGPQVREPVRDRLLAALARGGVPWQPVEGLRGARLRSAVRAVDDARVVRGPRRSSRGPSVA